MKRVILLLINIVVLAAAIAMAAGYASNLQKKQLEDAKRSFINTMHSMEKLSMAYLTSEQEYVNNWGTYISRERMELQEAMQFINNINSNEGVSVQIVDVDTLRGYSTLPNAQDSTDYTVSYDRASESLIRQLRSIALCENADSHLHVTQAFLNPVNDVQSVAICSEVTLGGDSGNEHKHLLLRIIPSEAMRAQWVFPFSYLKAEMGLIGFDGKYIVQAQSMGSGNFFEFIRTGNSLSFAESGELQKTMTESTFGTLEYKNVNGEPGYWVYLHLQRNINWILVGYVPMATLDEGVMDWMPILIVAGALLLLMAIDGAYLIQLNSWLRDSMDEARQANSAKTSFLSSMSHDIRTPMNAIVGMTAIASKHLDDPVQMSECLRKITLASNHLLTLINDVLDISKVESGKFSLNPVVFSMAELTANLVNIVRLQIKANAQTMEVRVRNLRHEYLFGDELRINQVYINILSNAVKYTPEHGQISLDIEEQPSPQGEKVARLVFICADTGIGMSKEFMETMYDTFSRAKDSRVNTIQGTGLGLAIVRRMVLAMGGSIDVQSQEGKGTTFTVTLDVPIADKLTDDLMLPPMRMLVVDDDSIFLETAVDTLKSLGISADTASSGEEAVAMVEREYNNGCSYPVIIVDWRMPGMNGLETTRRIRSVVGQDVSIIVISSYDWTDIEEEAKAAGANGFINKPLFRSTVYYKMNELLRFDESSQAPVEETAMGLEGLRLLVAEDNDLNWEIIEEMLDMYGIASERAENGQICLQKLVGNPAGTFDAVLMDVHMPVMDGKETAQTIRKSPLQYVQQTPIIAMTADAFAEDVKSCLESGMNGHVAKPVDLKKLFQELRKVLPKKGETA